MARIRIIFGLIIVAVIIFIAFLFFRNGVTIPFVGKSSTVTINNHQFTVSIARTLQEKETGLSGRNSLPQDQGMYFPFDTPGFYSFWMQGMKFPLDIIYINNNKVVTVFRNVPPPQTGSQPVVVKPTQPANAVLEISAGLSEKYTIKEGDSVKTSL